MVAGYFEISGAIVLQMQGADVERYLHNRLTNNIKRLAPGAATRAAALSPQGKTQGLFEVVRVSREEFLLWCDGGSSESVIAGLLRFKVADRIELCDRSAEFAVMYLTAELTSALLSGQCLVDDEARACAWGYAVRVHRTSPPGVDLVVQRSDLPKLIEWCQSQGGREISATERTVLRCKGGAPEFPGEIGENTLFAEAQARNAISFTKGCYVGQEVLERIDSHGSLPFRIVRIELHARDLPARRDRITLDVEPREGRQEDGGDEGGDGRVGEVVTAAYDEISGAVWCFGRLRGEVALPCAIRIGTAAGTASSLF